MGRPFPRSATLAVLPPAMDTAPTLAPVALGVKRTNTDVGARAAFTGASVIFACVVKGLFVSESE